MVRVGVRVRVRVSPMTCTGCCMGPLKVVGAKYVSLSPGMAASTWLGVG